MPRVSPKAIVTKGAQSLWELGRRRSAESLDPHGPAPGRAGARPRGHNLAHLRAVCRTRVLSHHERRHPRVETDGRAVDRRLSTARTSTAMKTWGIGLAALLAAGCGADSGGEDGFRSKMQTGCPTEDPAGSDGPLRRPALLRRPAPSGLARLRPDARSARESHRTKWYP